jgi:hypothetical protein
MYIGKPYTTIDPYDGSNGENQYFHALFLLGYSELKVTGIKIGEIDLCSNNQDIRNGMLAPDGQFPSNNPRLELWQGASNRTDGEVGLYPQKVVEEQLSIELLYPSGTPEEDRAFIRFSAKNPQKVQLEFTFNGLISYNDKGKKQNATVGIKIGWRKPGSPVWEEFGPIINCNYYYADTNGGTSTFTKQNLKVMRFIAEKTFDYSEIINVPERTIELRIVRTTSQAADGKTSDKAYLSAIRTWCFDYTASLEAGLLVPQVPMITKDRNRTCRLGFEIKAGSYLSGMIGAVNCIVQSCCRTWDGTSWSEGGTPTQNPASIALKALQSPMLGTKAYPDSKLDLDSFGEFYEWCDENIIEGEVTKKRFTCNGVLTTEKRLDDLLHAILITGRGMRILNGNKYGVLIDKPRENPVMILNNQNCLESTNSKEFEDLPDGYKIKFIDENDGYQENEIYAMSDGSNQPWPDAVIENVEMPFVTNPGQVFRNGLYQYACRKLRPEIWNRKIASEGNIISIGDLVEVQDDTIVVGIGDGAEIIDIDISGNYITGIKTDGLFDITDITQTYGIKITQYDGVNAHTIRTVQVVITEPGNYSDFILNSPISLNDIPVPSKGDIISFGIYDKITIDALCFGKKDDGDGKFDITLIPYTEGVYTADQGTIPAFDSKVTVPSSPQQLPSYPQDIYDKIDQIYDDQSDRPTYEEIVNGFTEAGVTVIPAQLVLSCVGGFRFISLSWGKQLTLSNLKEYEIQVSENAVDWYALRFDAVDWKGELDSVFATVMNIIVHPNIPPAGTEEEPAGRFLYYRVRQKTMLDDYSPWSEVVGAQTKLTDTGDYGVNSISANSLKAAEFFALFARLAETLIIDPRYGIASEISEWSDGDTRAVLNSREIAFQYFKKINDVYGWVNMAKLGISGVETSQVFSPDKLFIENDNMAGRRSKGYDIGQLYLSSSMRVAHCDDETDISPQEDTTYLLDQYGQNMFEIQGIAGFTGEDIILKSIAPYATDAKALLGSFRLIGDFGGTQTFTIDFWILFKWYEEQVIFKVGDNDNYIQVEVVNDEPYFNDEATDDVMFVDTDIDITEYASVKYDDVIFNDEMSDGTFLADPDIISGTWFNELLEAHTRAARYINGTFSYIVIIKENGDSGFVVNTWYHVAVIGTGIQLQLLINDVIYPFELGNISSLGVDINPSVGTLDGEHGMIMIDEIGVDTTVAEGTAQFRENNNDRAPWGNLDKQYPWAIFNVKNPDYFKTNIFKSPDFVQAVQDIIGA